MKNEEDLIIDIIILIVVPVIYATFLVQPRWWQDWHQSTETIKKICTHFDGVSTHFKASMQRLIDAQFITVGQNQKTESPLDQDRNGRIKRVSND